MLTTDYRCSLIVIIYYCHFWFVVLVTCCVSLFFCLYDSYDNCLILKLFIFSSFSFFHFKFKIYYKKIFSRNQATSALLHFHSRRNSQFSRPRPEIFISIETTGWQWCNSWWCRWRKLLLIYLLRFENFEYLIPTIKIIVLINCYLTRSYKYQPPAKCSEASTAKCTIYFLSSSGTTKFSENDFLRKIMKKKQWLVISLVINYILW